MINQRNGVSHVLGENVAQCIEKTNLILQFSSITLAIGILSLTSVKARSVCLFSIVLSIGYSLIYLFSEYDLITTSGSTLAFDYEL